MLGGFPRLQLPDAISHDDVLIGRCPTCRSVVEVKRSAATPPESTRQMTRRSNAEAGGFGAWFDLYSVECPVCVAKTAKVTGVDGQMQQGVVGPRVYLTRKGGGA
jgi:hypothetical protein